jgi:hypothetical protein
MLDRLSTNDRARTSQQGRKKMEVSEILELAAEYKRAKDYPHYAEMTKQLLDRGLDPAEITRRVDEINGQPPQTRQLSGKTAIQLHPIGATCI